MEKRQFAEKVGSNKMWQIELWKKKMLSAQNSTKKRVMPYRIQKIMVSICWKRGKTVKLYEILVILAYRINKKWKSICQTTLKWGQNSG